MIVFTVPWLPAELSPGFTAVSPFPVCWLITHSPGECLCAFVFFSPSAELFTWLVFSSKLQGAMCGRFCGLLKFFFLNLLLGRRVCLVAMEMCAVGLPAPPAGSVPAKWPCPRLDALRELLAHGGWEGGPVERAGRPRLAATHCTSGVRSEEKLAPICGLREAEREGRKRVLGLRGQVAFSSAPSGIDREGERRQGSVSSRQAGSGPKSKILFIL